ncbi:MAG: type II toxin-antitoxin system RelE/ParE family toxin [Gammaproteobacteria bacterium]|nr:type II toxin-antitoxin system RelE/ParE family toxin [Gammaproteobacteria bacterium]
MYRLTVKRHAIQALLKMPGQDSRRVREDLEKLAKEPDQRDIDVARLRGRPGFRLRVGGWRVIYERDDKAREIRILRIGPRGDVYKE